MNFGSNQMWANNLNLVFQTIPLIGSVVFTDMGNIRFILKSVKLVMYKFNVAFSIDLCCFLSSLQKINVNYVICQALDIAAESSHAPPYFQDTYLLFAKNWHIF